MLGTVSIVSDYNLSECRLIPLASDVVHKSSRITEQTDRLARPLARVDAANEEKDVNEEQVDY